jgi:hypothetical protein
MKLNHMSKFAGLTSAVGALALLLGFSGSATAGYNATGADGITASPKVRQLLTEQQRSDSKSGTLASNPMQCPMCQNKVTTRIDNSARGAAKPVIQVVKHLCNACGTNWKVAGVGKNRAAVASHTCGSCMGAKAGM